MPNQSFASSLNAVDVGNTSTHVGVFEPRRERGVFPIPVERRDLREEGSFLEFAKELSRTSNRWAIASVNRHRLELLLRELRQERTADDVLVLSHEQMPIGVNTPYPEQVGMDRLAGAVAANRLRDPRRPAVVVDAGTAVTVDAVAVDGQYLGGAILPGFAMAGRALTSETDLLPMVNVKLDEQVAAIGTSTESAIRSGVYWGTVGAIRELIDRIRHSLGNAPEVYFAGGDAPWLAELICPEAQKVPHLVLSGIAISAASAWNKIDVYK